MSNMRSDIDKLYRLYLNTIIKYIYYQTNDYNTAEELGNNVFITAMLKYDTIKGIDYQLQWLKKVAMIEILRYRQRTLPKLRRLVLSDNSDLEKLAGSYSPEYFINDTSYFTDIITAEEYHMLALRHVHGLSYKEIATIYGISPTNCSTKINRIKKKLHKELKPDIL